MAENSETEPSPWSEGYQINITRLAYDNVHFEEDFGRVTRKPITWKNILKNFGRQCRQQLSYSCADVSKALVAKVPFINTLRSYNIKQKLISDIIGGLSVGILHVPQGMGFALLAGVPPIYGLYSSFWPVLVYIFFGSGHHVCLGTMALISLMIGAVVEREAATYHAAILPAWGSNDTNYTVQILHLNSMRLDELGYESNINLTQTSQNSTTIVMPTGVNLDEQLKAFKVGIATSLTLLVGVSQLLMSILGLGMLTTFMPTPFIGGFTTGAAFHIATSQLKFILGINPPKIDSVFRLPAIWMAVVKTIDKANVAEFVTALICIVIMILIKTQVNDRFKDKLVTPVPIELIVVVLACIISYFANLSEVFGVKIIRDIPRGIPVPVAPPMTNFGNYISDAFIIALISFSITYSMGSLFASKYDYTILPNQELLALGLAHSASAFLSSFAGAAAPPRCLLLEKTKGSTQVAGIFTSLFILLVLLFIGPLFTPLPNSILGAIIIMAIVPLFQQFANLCTLWRINKYDFLIWLITWLAVTFIDITSGLVIGITFSVITLVFQALFSKGFSLGSLPGQDIFAPGKFYKNARDWQRVKIFQFQGSLHFASQERFKIEIMNMLQEDIENSIEPNTQKLTTRELENESEHVLVLLSPDDSSRNILKENTKENSQRKETESTKELRWEVCSNDHSKETLNSTKREREDIELPAKGTSKEAQPSFDYLVLDLTRASYLDVMGLTALRKVQADFAKLGIEVVLANVSYPVLRTLERSGGTWNTRDPIEVYPTVLDAVTILTQRSKLK